VTFSLAEEYFWKLNRKGWGLVVDMGQLVYPRSQYRSLSAWLFHCLLIHSLLRKIIRYDNLVPLLVYFFIY
jgi:hypothetical protein